MTEVEMDEDSLFDNAVSDEPENPIVETNEPEQRHEPEQAQPLEPEQPTAERPQVDDNAPMVPSWRVREINEEKRTLAERLAALEAEKANWQRPQPAQQAEKKEKAGKPDPLLDPDGYAKSVRDEIREEMLADRREESLVRAREANTKEFDEAYAAARQSVDPALKARMQASRDPGKTLLEWHRDQKTRQEIGGDLSAFKQRLRDEALKDPEFRKTAMAAWQSEAQSNVNGRPRVELPPSLSGASRSNAALRSSQQELSDDALWNEATA